MKNKTALLFVASALGLAWAIRGHFGHEHGAAWAGAIAALAVITAARRRDWTARLTVLAALAGIGWGVGGMMSYGIVVGYGRGVQFGNVFYGLSMLGVVGALYGFIGGGLFGLGLETTEDRKPQWGPLLAEMISGGLLVWWILIAQFEWKMTPPRSELWAGCLGAAVALAWFLQREGFGRSLRVAGYAALGAGFGFGFGNFLQTVGRVSGIDFNWWNVMEFSLGFFGGLGMAYGVLTRNWPEGVKPSKTSNWIAFLFLFLALPLVNLIQAMTVERFVQAAEQIGIEDTSAFANQQITISYFVTLIFFATSFLVQRRYSNMEKNFAASFAPIMLFLYVLFYLAFSHIIKLFFINGQPFQLNQVLYWVILMALFLMWFRTRGSVSQAFIVTSPETALRWVLLIGLALSVLAACSLVSISIQDGLPGSQERF